MSPTVRSPVKISGSKRFYGTNSLTVASEPDISGTEPYTLELWARPPDHPADSHYQFLISRETTSSSGRQGTGCGSPPPESASSAGPTE